MVRPPPVGIYSQITFVVDARILLGKKMFAVLAAHPDRPLSKNHKTGIQVLFYFFPDFFGVIRPINSERQLFHDPHQFCRPS